MLLSMSSRASYSQSTPKIVKIMSFEKPRDVPGGDHPFNRALNKALNQGPIDNNRLLSEGIQKWQGRPGESAIRFSVGGCVHRFLW